MHNTGRIEPYWNSLVGCPGFTWTLAPTTVCQTVTQRPLTRWVGEASSWRRIQISLISAAKRGHAAQLSPAPPPIQLDTGASLHFSGFRLGTTRPPVFQP